MRKFWLVWWYSSVGGWNGVDLVYAKDEDAAYDKSMDEHFHEVDKIVPLEGDGYEPNVSWKDKIRALRGRVVTLEEWSY